MSVHTLDAVQDEFCNLPTGIRICYRTYGPGNGEPLLLIAGLGLQLTSWPLSLIDGLTQRGFRVIVLDNRDVGRSSRIDRPGPGLLRQFLRRPAEADYDLGDMAADAVGLLDHLNITSAHVAGMSMGGMISQVIAARYPQRTLSLTSIFSTTGARKVGQPAFSSMLMLAGRPARTREQAVRWHQRIIAHIGPQTYAVNEEAMRAYAIQAWDRGLGARNREGMTRQIGAIIKSGDRTEEVRRIQAPTLVIHGDLDLMVAHSGGLATAEAIAGSQMVTIRGMGHYLPDGVLPLLAGLIDEHARRSAASAEKEPVVGIRRA